MKLWRKFDIGTGATTPALLSAREHQGGPGATHTVELWNAIKCTREEWLRFHSDVTFKDNRGSSNPMKFSMEWDLEARNLTAINTSVFHCKICYCCKSMLLFFLKHPVKICKQSIVLQRLWWILTHRGSAVAAALDSTYSIFQAIHTFGVSIQRWES